MTRLTAKLPQHLNAEQYDVANEQDIRGYQLFSQGEVGEAHCIAHEMFDAGRITDGHQRLAGFLSQHDGHGSDWVHLQFHMAVFELELGDWQTACKRFWNEILPTASTTSEALTDAPALLWRLKMTAPQGVVLPWQPLRRTALSALSQVNTSFLQIHNLLALAGAGDAASIESWSPVVKTIEEYRLMRDFSGFCSAIARERVDDAGKRLNALQPSLVQLDGSHAQLQLFDQLNLWIEREIQGETKNLGYLDAA